MVNQRRGLPIRACAAARACIPIVSSLVLAVSIVGFSGLDSQKASASSPDAWSQQSPLISPSARDSGGMTYDPATGTTMLFGGTTGTGALNDTWEWDGSDWAEDNPTTSPSPRTSPGLAFDPVNDDMLLFGGRGPSDSTMLNDTWSWDGDAWTLLSPSTSPPGADQYAMATNTQSNYVLLITTNGGAASDFQTWEWNGSDWTQQHPSTSPSCGDDCGDIRNALAFDPTHHVMLLQDLNTTWEWNGFDWLQLDPTTEVGGLLTTGPENNGLLVLTGYAATWSGNDWTELTGTAAPSTRANAMFSDGPTGAVLFGGDTNEDDFDRPESGDQTWVFGPADTGPPAATPEIALPVLLPLSLLALGGAGYEVKRRRARRPSGLVPL
jgi:hypothetical protein